MAKASINIKPIQQRSESHNLRITKMPHIYPELTKNNETLILEDLHIKRQAIKRHCKITSGRAMQRNAKPIREGVINLNVHHTMKDLKELSKQLKEEYGIDCFQIHIHRDEGKSRDELNYHAHMIFDWQNKKTGKTIKITKLGMSQMQTLTARVLGMERGELKTNSNRIHLEPIEYKRQEEEKKLATLQRLTSMEEKKNQRIKDQLSSTQKQFQQAKKRYIEYTHENERIKRLSRQFVIGVYELGERPKKEVLCALRAAIKTQLQIADKQEEYYHKTEKEITAYEETVYAQEYRRLEKEITAYENS